MRVRPKAVIGILVGWGLIIFFVALLTVIFSFLGTLICAGLAGMMMGAARLPRWQSFMLSLVFPGVLFVALAMTHAQLAGRQVLLLAMLCFGLFWIIYLAIGTLVSGEGTAAARQDAGSQPTGIVRHPPELMEGNGQVSSARRELPPGPDTGTAGEGCCCMLEQFQGTWVPESVKADGAARRKVLHITQEHLLLIVSNGEGEIHLRARADLKCSTGPVLNLQSAGSVPKVGSDFHAANI